MAADDKSGKKPDAQGASAEEIKAAKESMAVRLENIELLKKEIETLNKKLETLRELSIDEESENEIIKQNNKLEELRIQKRREELKIAKELGTIKEEDIKNELIELRQAEKKIENYKRTKEGLDQIKVGWGGVVFAQSVAAANVKPFFDNMSRGFTWFQSAQLMMLEKLGSTFASLEEAQKQAAQSGISMYDSKTLGQYVGLAKDANGEMKTFTSYGVGFKEMSEATYGLRDSMIDFTDQAADTQNQLAANAATMKNLGVDIGTTGKNFNFLTKSLGITGKDVAKVNDQLAKTGIAAGISVKKMLTDFGQIGPQLAAQGPKAIQIFGDLAKQAKSLGVEVGDLMNTFGNAMDTFEGAAGTAGKFNAVMGGDYLNAVELLNATESERVEIVKRQMDATGKNFATMSKYEKIAVANALGIKDVNLAQKMLAGSTDEMRKKQELEAANEEKLNQLKEEAVGIGARLASMFQVVTAVMMPFFSILEGVAKMVTRLNDGMAGLPAIAIAGYLLANSFGGLSGMLSNVWNKFRGTTIAAQQNKVAAAQADLQWQKNKIRLEQLAGATDDLAVAERNLLNAQQSLLESEKKAASSPKGFIAKIIDFLPMAIMLFMWLHDVLVEPHSPPMIDVIGKILPAGFTALGDSIDEIAEPMLKFGGGILMVGAGIFLAAFGMAKLVQAFAGLEPAQIMGAVIAIGLLAGVFIVMAGVLYLIATASSVAAIPMLAFGAAILMVGIGIGIAAAGMSLLVESFVQLLNGGANVEQVLGLAFGLYVLAGGVASLGLAFAGLALIAIPAWLGAKAIANAIENIGEAYDEFPSEKSVSFKASTDSLSEILTKIKEVKNADIEPTVGFMKEAQQYMITAGTFGLTALPAMLILLQQILAVATKGVNSASRGGGEGEGKKETYEIKLNEKVFGELVRKEAGVGAKASSKIA